MRNRELVRRKLVPAGGTDSARGAVLSPYWLSFLWQDVIVLFPDLGESRIAWCVMRSANGETTGYGTGRACVSLNIL